MSGKAVALALVGLTVFLCPQASTAQPEEAAPRMAARPGPLEPRRVGDGVTKPVKISGNPPVYTELARKARVQGAVILESIIDELGEVVDIRILKGLPMGLDQSAIDAVRTWRFEPATFEGKPVKVYYSLTVNFRVASGSYRGPAFHRFLAANADFAAALREARYDEAARLLDRSNDPGRLLAWIYLQLEQELLDNAWGEAERYQGADRHEALVAVGALALQSAQTDSQEPAVRARALELGTAAATAAIEAQPKSVDAIGLMVMLLREQAGDAADPDEKRRLTEEAAQFERRGMEALRAAAANEEPAADDDAPLRIDGEVRAPRKVAGSTPVSTEEARKARVYGSVTLAVVIDEQGQVTDALVVSGLPMGLDRAAVEAVKGWRYEPATLHGRPVKVYDVISVDFPETPETVEPRD